MRMKIEDIKISETFAESKPSIAKYAKCDKIYKKIGLQDRYIVVNQDNVLIDGYIMYLVLKENNADYADVKRIDMKKYYYMKDLLRRYSHSIQESKLPTYKEELTTYVYGVHPNSLNNKEYVWRVPNKWTNFSSNIEVGDMIYCSTKYGVSPVIVTKFVERNCWNTDLKIKKVVSKRIIRNGELINV